jgi:hypothetical protein
MGSTISLAITQEKTQKGWVTKEYLTVEMQLYTLQGMIASQLFTASIYCLESLSNYTATKPKSSASWEQLHSILSTHDILFLLFYYIKTYS